MLKLMSSALLLMIVSATIHSINGEALQCKFGEYEYFNDLGYVYSCLVTALENPNDNKIITGYNGVHQANKYDKDVKQLYISEKNTYFIPEKNWDFGSVFNITALIIRESKLVEIRSKDFHGMQNLEYLSLINNKLTSVPSDAFSTLKKLKYLSLYKNQIQEISSELFSNNLNLEYVDFDNNKIKYIGSEVFNQLRNLNKVEFVGNICLQKDYIGIDGITQMKNDIITNCKNPATTTTITTTTTQNPMEVELEALKNELSACKETQQKNQNELNKLKDYLQKEQLENINIRKDKDAMKKEAKGQQQMKEIELNKLRDDLKKEQLENSKVKMNYQEVGSRNDQLKSELSALKLDLQKKVNYTIKINSEKKNLIIELAKKDLKNELAETKNEIKKIKFAYEELNVKLTKCEANQRKSMEFNLICDFKMINDGQYTCETRDLTIHQKEMKLNVVNGTHLKSKSNEEVTELIIMKSSMFYWSKDIFTKFPALQTLRIQNAQLNELTKGDFSSAFNLRFLVVNGNNIAPFGDDVFLGTEENLTEINLNSNQIEKISPGTFHGLKKLKVLSLKDNLITEIPLGTFKDIVMLEILILTGNKIRYIDGKMLEFNKRLMTLAVDQNEIREVGEEILVYSKMLKDVNFEGNDCIDERTGVDDDDTIGRTINDLNFVIRNCCKNPEEELNVFNCGYSGSVN